MFENSTKGRPAIVIKSHEISDNCHKRKFLG